MKFVKTAPFYLQVALPVPIRHSFTYLPQQNTTWQDYHVGARVSVPFGKRNMIGIVSRILKNPPSISKDNEKFELKKVTEIIDKDNILTDNIVELVEFASEYYQYPVGGVYFSCLPKLIRQGESLDKYTNKIVFLNTDYNQLKNSKKISKTQEKLFELLAQSSHGVSLFALDKLGVKQRTVDALIAQKWVYVKESPLKDDEDKQVYLKQDLLLLNQEQKICVDTVLEQTSYFNKFKCFLLYGITGSGKTEVYMHLIVEALQQEKQVLILVPEISLTPQTIERFKQRFNTKIAVIHSKISGNTKTKDWLAARDNSAKIIIGTRSAVFTPIQKLGLIIIDEEHDQSFKQQEGFRYNARDLAIIRAQKLNVPIILGSATPSIESVANAITQKYELLTIKQRAGEASLPKIKLLNIKQKKLTCGLSDDLIQLMKQRLQAKQQVLLFLNRRGYAPVIKCSSCDWGAMCPRCNVYYTAHKHNNLMICHYCSSQKQYIKTCPDCHNADLVTYGVGTEQIEEYISDIFKEYVCVRVDRDVIKNKKDLDNVLDKINLHEANILIGTQMLAKGHHFPNVSLVGVLGCDNSLFSTDFRAPERLTQLLLQVSGRAGRSNIESEVIIQTMQPEHQLLQDILHKDYWQIAEDLYRIRTQADLPPANHWALLRAESYNINNTLDFLTLLKKTFNEVVASSGNKINAGLLKVSGPILAPRIKKAGLFRGQLLISCKKRAYLHTILSQFFTIMSDVKSGSVRWSIDIDPQEIY